MPDSSELATYARLLRLTPVRGASEVDASAAIQIPDTTSPVVLREPVVSRGWVTSFLVCVIAPTYLVAAYFWFLAIPRYESEARFILKTTSQTIALPQASNIVQSIGISRTNDDSYIVREFLESRDALESLTQRSDFRQIVDRGERDPFWRFPSWFTRDTNEGLYKYFRRIVSANFDSTTGVSVLRTQAFTAQDAQRLSMTLIEAAESLVNRLNKRARQDAISNAEAEADRQRERALAAQSAITSFRERERLIDPAQQTLAVLETIGKLGLEAANLSVQINEISSTSAKAPQLAPLRTRRAAIETQIAVERQKLAGDARSIAPRIAEYERLMLEREFAEKALFAAMAAVEMTRHDASRKQIYLERITTPSQPDYPTYPWRIVWTLTAAVIGYAIWRIWRILSMDALQHLQD